MHEVGGSAFEYLVLGLFRSLQTWTEQASPVVALRLHRRRLARGETFSDVAGWFAGDVPLNYACLRTDTAEAELEGVRRFMHELPAGGVGYELLARRGDVPRVEELTFVRLNVQPMGSVPDSLEITDAYVHESACHPRPFLLDCIVRMRPKDLNVIVRYSNRRHRRSTVQAFVQGWTEAVQRLTDQPYPETLMQTQ